MMKFAVSICATRAYTHAMVMQSRRVQQCVALTSRLHGCEGHVILSGDNSAELKAIAEHYKRLMPLGNSEKGVPGWQIHLVASVKEDDSVEQPHKNHDAKTDTEAGERSEAARKAKAFRRVGDMREAAHAFAVRLEMDFVWSIDSDVIPPVNALRTMFDSLTFDEGYYSVAFCPYPNLLWLGGMGEPGKPMAEDFLPLERKLPAPLRESLEAVEKSIKDGPVSRELIQQKQKLETEARTYPPDGNIWEVTAKHGWRRRGWLDHAYPGIGLGAMVPSDWCGYGCTLMSSKALVLSDFIGFEGQGATEDVFVIAHRWQPAGLRIAVLPHCPCDHVYFEQRDGKPCYTYLRAYHEPAGEYRGHLRYERRPFAPPVVDGSASA